MLLRWSRRSWLKATLATAGAALPASSLIAPQESLLFGAEPWQKLPVAQPTPSLVPEQLCRRVVLEMSLKPYRKLDDATLRSVAARAFEQWRPLIRRAESAAVLLWIADGSEILEYRGRKEDEIEWARYLGMAHPADEPLHWDPAGQSLHSKPQLYMADPPRITYGDLARIVASLKEVGRQATGKPVYVGATFDPGPEFARSPFKYERHKEIAQGDTAGKGRWVSCAAVLHADDRPYAGFPQGIPEGTSLGTFLGKQTAHFARDLGFDYLWLSNGFGFSLTAWSTKGILFDGKRFDTEKAESARQSILGFWRDFRRACDLPLETRGTNLATGNDLATAATPLADIYSGDFNMVAPPNSPWGALDGDFGLEIVGYLSRIVELPPNGQFPFRFYTHDPWWLNSPWFDRYGRSPHDIYLPLAVARIDAAGQVSRPSHVALLTIDDSFGNMPDQCPIEVIPHIVRGLENYSDAPGLMTWIYPFAENHRRVFEQGRSAEAFFGDWFLRGALNDGLPLNSVVSTENFLAVRRARPDVFAETILLAPVPDAGSALETELIAAVREGARVLLYGPLTHAGPALLAALGLKRAEPIEGTLTLEHRLAADSFGSDAVPDRIEHNSVVSAGGVDAVVDPGYQAADDDEVCATVRQGDQSRVYAVCRTLGRGRLAWVRGSVSATVTNARLPVPHDPRKLFLSERLLRWLLPRLGVVVRFDKPSIGTRSPMVLAARCRNGYYVSGYCPSTVVEIGLRWPLGAPVFVGHDGVMRGGTMHYRLPRAWHHEVRILLEQQAAGEISCIERYSGQVGVRRRLHLRGLNDATVHFLPETGADPAKATFAVNNIAITNTKFHPVTIEDDGRRVVGRGITGELVVSW